jgi:hypothetical protein
MMPLGCQEEVEMRRIIGLMVVVGFAALGCGSGGGGTDSTGSKDVVTPADTSTGSFGCGSAMDCGESCQTDACFNECVGKITTANGKSLIDALVNCGTAACPNTSGGVCENGMSQACMDCWGAAFSGTCKSQGDACNQDG